jgi:hypothetical protein
MFSIYLILPAALGPRVYSASNKMSIRSIEIMFLESRALPMRKADCLDNVGSLTYQNPIGLHSLLLGQLYILLIQLREA